MEQTKPGITANNSTENKTGNQKDPKKIEEKNLIQPQDKCPRRTNRNKTQELSK
uniref:Uncharacterized protein n=1 Tax=Arundo donax TaxID=35708 RepID=A0A0A9AJY4_ARUDO